MIRPAFRRRRLGLVALSLICLASCTESNTFSGRLTVRNATGGPLRSPRLGYILTYPDGRRTGAPEDLGLDLSDLADGLEWSYRAGGDRRPPLPTGWDLVLTWDDPAGKPRTAIIPFDEGIPRPCSDDYTVTLFGDGKVRCELESP